MRVREHLTQSLRTRCADSVVRDTGPWPVRSEDVESIDGWGHPAQYAVGPGSDQLGGEHTALKPCAT